MQKRKKEKKTLNSPTVVAGQTVDRLDDSSNFFPADVTVGIGVVHMEQPVQFGR